MQAQMITEERYKAVSDSRVETMHLMRPAYLNGANRLFGGILMQWIDEVAGLVAKRHSEMNVTTASVDHLSFLNGVFVDERIVLIGVVTHVGNTSMEIKVETFVEHVDCTRELVNQAFLTMVALDKNGKPARIPRLLMETQEEKDEWELAEVRKAERKKLFKK